MFSQSISRSSSSQSSDSLLSSGQIRPSVRPPPDYSAGPYDYSHTHDDRAEFDDPRTSSAQSLRPVETSIAKRKLLLVYIHGFLGAEASFQHFPSHVHSLLTISLADTHVIHTKIYPRYQSRRNISIAREAFSKWLTPHEAETTDVIILGHSLGGILAAEIVLIPGDTTQNSNLFRHRILGLVAFDTPFLGIHPGVIPTGIASLFKPSPEEWSGNTNENISELYNSSLTDPNYNPNYMNDIHLPVRDSMWDRAQYFWNKHAGHLVKATKAYVTSYFEFGGCLLDYNGLRRRYESVRALDDVDDLKDTKGPHGKLLRRVRFVNYYSTCTPKSKKVKDKAVDSTIVDNNSTASPTNIEVDQSPTPDTSDQRATYPSLVDKWSTQHQSNNVTIQVTKLDIEELNHHSRAVDIGPADDFRAAEENSKTNNSSSSYPEYMSSPDLQKVQNSTRIEPSIKNLSVLSGTIEDTQCTASIRAPRESSPSLSDKISKIDDTARSNDSRLEVSDSDENDVGSEHHTKERKFCTLPRTNGIIDSKWERIHMDSADEVVAHTSLFFISDAYARLVGDTTERITKWVHDGASIRALLAERNSGNF